MGLGYHRPSGEHALNAGTSRAGWLLVVWCFAPMHAFQMRSHAAINRRENLPEKLLGPGL